MLAERLQGRSRSEDFEDSTSLRSSKTPASRNSALQRERRPVTPEVAGSSPVAPALYTPLQGYWFARLAAEQDNFRAALVLLREAGMAESTLRSAAALWRFWWMRGAVAEGRRWYELRSPSHPVRLRTWEQKRCCFWPTLDAHTVARDPSR